jgi:hypothetical protein
LNNKKGEQGVWENSLFSMKRLAIAMKIATVIATETDAIALQTKLSLK